MSKKTQRVRACAICGKAIKTTEENMHYRVLLCKERCFKAYWCALNIKYGTLPIKNIQIKKDYLAKYNIVIK